MGTTVVCLVLAGTKAIVGHVGDSRVYLLRGGQAHRLTEDHTLIAAQLKAGTLTHEQAHASQLRNVITRAVGIQESVQVDTLMVDLLPEGLFLLCSDGLHGYVPDEELASVVADIPLAELPTRLVALANERGGKDNVTVVVVRHHRRRGAARGAGGDQQPDGGAEEHPHLPAPHLQGADGDPLHRLDAHLPGRTGDRRRGSVRRRALHRGPGPGAGGDGRGGRRRAARRAATSARWASWTTRRGAPPCARSSRPASMVIARADLMQLMKRESILAVKMLWSFVQVLSDRLRATNYELSEVRQELAVAQAMQPFAEE